MKKIFLIILLITPFLLGSCKKMSQEEKPLFKTSELFEESLDGIKISSTDKNGIKLEVLFNNADDTATIFFSGDSIELSRQISASGFRYENETYQLLGKGYDMELRKNGNLIFSHYDDIVTTSLKNKKGDTLDITFNNTRNQAKAYLNGGKQIDLIGQKPASGIWYKNQQYELRGKGEKVELFKDGKIVFKN